MRESIQDLVRVTGPWVGGFLVVIGLALELANFGLWPGLLYAGLSLLGVLFVCLLAYSVWAARQVRDLRTSLGRSEQDRTTVRERLDSLERVLEQVASGTSEVGRGVGVQRMIDLMLMLLREVDAAIEFKKVERALGRSTFPVTQLEWDRDREVVKAHVVYTTEPPFVQGQSVDYHMSSQATCRGTVMELDHHSATVELSADDLPSSLLVDLKTLSPLPVPDAYVTLPVLPGLRVYDLEQLIEIRPHLQGVYDFLVALLEGGAA